MSTSAFSSSCSEVLERKVEKTLEEICVKDIQEFYEIDKCQYFIKDGKYEKIALQFPDELLCDSSEVTKILKTSENSTVFILGDTSYGSCCVDEVAAQHSNADCIIHFGRSCLSQTVRLPVLHVFGHFPVDIEDCCVKFKRLLSDVSSHIIIFYDTIFHHLAGEIMSKIQSSSPNIVLSQLNIPPSKTKSENSSPSTEKIKTINRCNRSICLLENTTLDSYQMFYIGCEGQTLSNLMMNFSQNKFLSYDPFSKVCRYEDININKALMKRFYMIERVKDANIVGIVVGTLGAVNYIEIIKRIKLLLKSAGKKFYTFVVGKLNVAKLGNFLEVDVFVLVSCSENTLVDTKEFYKPIVTPFELEIACNTDRQWTGDYRTDFKEILPGSESYVPLTSNLDTLRVDVSLVTNKLRSMGNDASVPSTNIKDVQLGTDKTVTIHTAGDYLSNRSWKGLEQNLGETPVAKASVGQKGIAMEYSNESAS